MPAGGGGGKEKAPAPAEADAGGPPALPRLAEEVVADSSDPAGPIRLLPPPAPPPPAAAPAPPSAEESAEECDDDERRRRRCSGISAAAVVGPSGTAWTIPGGCILRPRPGLPRRKSCVRAGVGGREGGREGKRG